ncbi:MAG: glutamate 5-kinase [bacterium]|nr:glutamate 5-kinase [bacterium]
MVGSTSLTSQRKNRLADVKRVVIKVGSGVIASSGRLHPRIIGRIASDVVKLREQGYEVLMVVSGAVAAGYPALNLSEPPAGVVERQASAAIGQYLLMGTWARAFGRQGIDVAQLLMMDQDIEDRRRFISARHTLHCLIETGVIPIINENDPLADDELKIGDNDHLAALVTSVATADLLIILSTVPGLRENGAGPVIPEVAVGSRVEHHITSSVSESGVGGMHAKVAAAKLASRWGVPTVIAPGAPVAGRSPILEVMRGRPVGTIFWPASGKLSSRKRWIAVRAKSRGVVYVDRGARQAIVNRKASLLPAGVTDVKGRFQMGARVDVGDDTGQTFAVGLVSYSSEEIRRMRGKRQADFKRVLGYEYVPEIIDRGDLVVLTP